MSRFTCPECGGGFPSPSYLAKTLDGVLMTDIESCPWCGESFDFTPRHADDPEVDRP